MHINLFDMFGIFSAPSVASSRHSDCRTHGKAKLRMYCLCVCVCVHITYGVANNYFSCKYTHMHTYVHKFMCTYIPSACNVFNFDHWQRLLFCAFVVAATVASTDIDKLWIVGAPTIALQILHIPVFYFNTHSLIHSFIHKTTEHLSICQAHAHHCSSIYTSKCQVFDYGHLLYVNRIFI